jgi:uncharacterized OB-fold protein
MAERPVPVPDEISWPFWDGTASHKLVLARCSICSQLNHPPDPVCAHCFSTEPDYEWTSVDGSGIVRSWTIVRQSFLPGFDVPFALVDVELAVQRNLRLIGRLLDGPDAVLQAGDSVELAFEDLTPDIAVPAFTLRSPRE